MKKLLYVDDAKSMRRLVEMVLESHYELTLAEDGVQGLKAIQQQAYDIIISDVNMPNMDGFDFLRTIRQQPQYQSIPILMMTTEADEEMKQQGKSLGATGWIIKPFIPDKLIQVIERLTN
ncbi:response regulator [Thiomicrorhabdus sp. ZW0627]|uniref:response regulator n=1 Tax=Thiomicrorhabdus sp. ZW0627 TaxID=3039774 RepID=UPI0024369D79|nr:response regulator [Thiomicrorhabdus sp. ZW0627]MDG6773119.1 response regulator [Thiomicrorhabdus sp. ZW0627]